MSERQTEWIPIEEAMPKAGKKVIVSGLWPNGNRWQAMASWQPKGTVDTLCWDETPEEWEDYESGEATNPEDLWLEASVELETVGFLENVTHWLALPSLPNDKDLARRALDSE